MSVAILREALKNLEASLRFGGRPCPTGIEPFPRALVGQGFFPGGDGLWRDPHPAALRKPSPYAFPKNGIMFLGNDFGTVQKFKEHKLHENPPTWWRLRKRLEAARIPGELGFYTNAYLGLRNDRSALATALENKLFGKLCAEYLDVQIRTQMPRMIVTLGPRPAALINELLPVSNQQVGQLYRSSYSGQDIGVIVVSHPFSDFGKKGPVACAEEGKILARAWAAI